MNNSKLEFIDKLNKELKPRIDMHHKFKDNITGKVLLADIPEYFDNYGFMLGCVFVKNLIEDMEENGKLRWNNE